ncbi:MAG: calcium-binding protein, partial [Alphaproteobacteria bacterium]
MIQIKSRESAASGPNRNRPYAFGDERASLRGPGIVGLALAAIATYFSQFFNSAEAAAPGAEDDARGPEAPGEQMTREAPRTQAPVRLEEGGGNPAAEDVPTTDVVEAEGRTVLHFPRATLGSGWFTQTVSVIEPGPGFSIHAPVASNSDRPPVALPDPTQGGGAPSGAAAGGAATTGQRARDANADAEEERNRAPQRRGPVELGEMTVCPAFLITVGMLLEGASDADGDTLSVTDLVASSGTLTPTDGGWLYTPDPTVTGPVVLSYQITDGKDGTAQTAHFELVPNTIEGTNNSDLLVGSECIDQIDGMDGDDNIVARGGNDIIRGGDGDDHIVGGGGDDTIFAGAGDDIVYAGAGDDVVFGGTGNDWIIAGSGDDVVYGEEGNDTIEGDGGKDILFGGEGNDTISDGSGADVVDAGQGDDLVMATADQSRDALAGGAGEDTLDASDGDTDVTVDLSAGTVEMGDAPADAISGFEQLVTGDGDDTVLGDDEATRIETAAGDDEVTDGAGADVVDAGDGDDRVIVAADSDAD